MFLAVTPNPSIDRNLYLSSLVMGSVQRVERVHLSAGGKGLNVARALASQAIPVTACGPLAGYSGLLLAALARSEGLKGRWFRLSSGETRNCLLVHHGGTDTTVINEPGDLFPKGDWERFAGHIRALAAEASAITFSGSQLPGPTPAALAKLAGSLTAGGKMVFLDTSGPELRCALEEPSGLVVKINSQELLAAWGLESAEISEQAIHDIALQVLSRGASMIVVTRGADGALLFSGQGHWQGRSPTVKALSSVGCGDAFLAGLAGALQAGLAPAEALQRGILWGTANTLTSIAGRLDAQALADLADKVSVLPFTV